MIWKINNVSLYEDNIPVRLVQFKTDFLILAFYNYGCAYTHYNK